jgi:ubiquinone/menaquinone biosynthesis C-methylase UbiE
MESEERMSIGKRWEHFIDRQYRRPTGIIGQVIGSRMVRQHEPENVWSVGLLDVQPTDHVLEVGFGPGLAIALLTERASRGLVTGVDFSPAMLALARRRNARAIKTGRVVLRAGEATALPFADATFDKALSIHTLYFWPDPGRALTELRRVLKPGGRLVLTFLPEDRWPGGVQAATIAGVYTGQEVAQLLHEAGFAQAQVEPGPEQKPFREIAITATR